jgi:hypothetical protein
MRLEPLRSLRGFRPIGIGGDRLLLARRHVLYTAPMSGGSPRAACVLPATPLDRLASRPRLLRRVLRLGVHCGLPLGGSRFLVSFRRGIYLVDVDTGRWELERDTSDGFRPMAFAALEGIPGFTDGACFGEYDGRITHAPIRIFQRSAEGRWRAAHTFPAGEVDHVHGVVPDPRRACVWILAGDYGRAAGLWRAEEDFRRVTPVLRGEQDSRTCNLFPMEDGLLYATDSHLEKNSLRWLEEAGGVWRTRPLRAMPGPSFYACRVGRRSFFSTSVEPGAPSGRIVRDLLDRSIGPGVDAPVCEIVGGSVEEGFATLVRWRADALPKRLFQSSAIFFPSGASDLDVVVAYGIGVRGHDDRTEIFAIRE